MCPLGDSMILKNLTTNADRRSGLMCAFDQSF